MEQIAASRYLSQSGVMQITTPLLRFSLQHYFPFCYRLAAEEELRKDQENMVSTQAEEVLGARP